MAYQHLLGPICALLATGLATAQITVQIPALDEVKVDVTLSWSGNAEPTSGQLKITTPWQGTLDLDPSQSWTLEAQAEGYWSPPMRLPSKKTPIRVLLIPTVEFTGSFEGSPEDPTPENFHAWVNRSPIESVKKPAWQPITCLQTDENFACEVPIDALDLKISSDGYVPLYRWGLEPREPVDFGRIHLRRGGSLSGWMIAEGGQGPLSARLIPRTIGWQTEPTEQARTRLRVLEATVNPKDGFFSIGPVPAGGYDLELSREGLPPLLIEDLDLTTGEEVLFEEVFELVSAPTLDVYLTPPVNPEQQPWEVVLMKTRTNSNTLKTLHRAAAGFDGHWHLDTVPEGKYRLEVRDYRGSTWLVRELLLDSPREPLFFDLDSVAVEGRLNLGDEPADGMVIFGTRQGRPNVALKSVEGGFSGVLPRGGIWEMEVEIEGLFTVSAEPVTVESTAGGAASFVEIDLPNTAVEGEVRQGAERISNAFVRVAYREGSQGGKPRRSARVRTNDEGKFKIRGLPPGPVQVAAYLGAFDPASDWIPVEIDEGIEPPYLELELQEKTEFRAQVMGPQGPIAGAQVYVETGTAASMSWPTEAISDSKGVARFRLPQSAHQSRALFVVIAAGYGVSVQRGVLTEGGEVLLALGAEKGDLVLGNTFGTLSQGDVAVPIATLFQRLASANRLFPAPESGLLFRGMAVGEYSQCHESGQQNDCISGILTPGSTLRLELTDSRLLEELFEEEP